MGLGFGFKGQKKSAVLSERPQSRIPMRNAPEQPLQAPYQAQNALQKPLQKDSKALAKRQSLNPKP